MHSSGPGMSTESNFNYNNDDENDDENDDYWDMVYWYKLE